MFKNRAKALTALFTAYVLILAGWSLPTLAQQGSNSSYVAGERNVAWYAFGRGFVQGAYIASGNTSTGSQTIQVCPGIGKLPDGRQINLFGGIAGLAAVPITVDAQSSTNVETVTPTAVSLTGPQTVQGSNQQVPCANITASFSFTHANSQNTHQVISGDGGLQEAMNDAQLAGGGVVTVGPESAALVTNTILTAAAPYPGVVVADKRFGYQIWNPQGGATTLATPATLTALTSVPSTTPVGTFTATNYNMCIAYVDILGQEGPCSTSFVNAGAGATSSFVFTAPAASAGAVGYTIYVGLTGAGSTTLQYKVPLVAQPTVLGATPLSNGVCTLTKIEFITPACSLTNATYNQTGVGASVTAITVNTSPIQPTSTATSTTSVYIPNPGGRTTYAYAPGAHIGSAITVPSALAFTIGAAAATTVPNVIGTINIAPNAMNVVGKTLEICGEATTTASAATIVDIQFQWDAMGQNTAGKGVLIGDLTATPAAAIATAGHAMFCQDFQTTVASASATGGSINHVGGSGAVGGVSLIAPGALSDAVTPGAIGSLNLAVDARINIIYLHTTATDGAGWTLQNLTAKLI